MVDDRTVELAERALKNAPTDGAILDTLGWIRYLRGQFADDATTGREGAVTLIRRSLAASTKDPSLEVLDHLGDALWATQDREGAASAWRDAVRLAAERFDRNTTLPQLNAYLLGECGMRLVEPEAFYEQHFGRAAQRAAQKLAEVEAGRPPATTPSLAEAPPSLKSTQP